MKFVCGACGETIKKVNSPKHHASFVPHPASDGENGCGYETFFPTHVYTPKSQDPAPTRVRKIGDDGEGVSVKEFRREPSAADLDKVAEEKRAAQETATLEPRAAAIGYLVSTGKSEEEAVKLVDEIGVDKILKSKINADAKAAKKAEKAAKEAAKATSK